MAEEQKWPDVLWVVRHGESAGNAARDHAEASGLGVIELATRDPDLPLSNLGRRQADALGENGRILLRARTATARLNGKLSDVVMLEVEDNGPGIPEDLRSRLFTKFYRAQRSLIAGTRGTWLGLFISKTIIELQGGKIGLEADKGHGSTFYFTLPATGTTAGKGQKGTAITLSSYRGKKNIVLAFFPAAWTPV